MWKENCTSGACVITFNPNGGSVSPTSETTTVGGTVTPPIPTRTNYAFTGWYTASSGGEKVNLTDKYYTSTTIYAQWAAVSSFSISSMQSMSSTICSKATIGTTRSMTDSRDSNAYTVVKLADGNCWMTQSLRLVGSRTLTSSDSNVSASFTLPASTNPWTATNDAAMVYDYISTNNSVYYNYYAASAGTISGDSNTTLAQYSICPKNWRLPTQPEYAALIAAYYIRSNADGSEKMRSAPLNFIFSGYHNAAGYAVAGLNGNGRWWSATAATGNAAKRYGVYFTSTAVTTIDSSNDGRKIGFPIRCIAQ